MHRNCELLFDRYAKSFFKPGMSVLEIGPDVVPSSFERAAGRSHITWHTLDIRSDVQRTFSGVSEYSFPIDECTYDIVVSGNVLEHVRRIWVWIRELARVCKRGGHVITINPVSWPYHEAPVDCWRVYPEGMRALYEEASLEVLLSKCESIEGEKYEHVIPGRGLDWQSANERSLYRRLAGMGGPIQCALDSITMGRKPRSST